MALLFPNPCYNDVCYKGMPCTGKWQKPCYRIFNGHDKTKRFMKVR